MNLDPSPQILIYERFATSTENQHLILLYLCLWGGGVCMWVCGWVCAYTDKLPQKIGEFNDTLQLSLDHCYSVINLRRLKEFHVSFPPELQTIFPGTLPPFLLPAYLQKKLHRGTRNLFIQWPPHGSSVLWFIKGLRSLGKYYSDLKFPCRTSSSFYWLNGWGYIEMKNWHT